MSVEEYTYQFMELIRLVLHGGRGDMITVELLHEFLPSDGGGIFGSGTIILPPN